MILSCDPLSVLYLKQNQSFEHTTLYYAFVFSYTFDFDDTVGECRPAYSGHSMRWSQWSGDPPFACTTMSLSTKLSHTDSSNQSHI